MPRLSFQPKIVKLGSTSSGAQTSVGWVREG
jgi:hypothetical protein